MRKSFLVLLMLVSFSGCKTLDSFRAAFTVDPKTGEVTGDLKGAGEGGQYHENVGLNMSLGDNTIPAIAVVAMLAAGIVFAYPVQRAMRRKRERGLVREWEETPALKPNGRKTD